MRASFECWTLCMLKPAAFSAPMVATRGQKRSAEDSKYPLQQAGILQRVLDHGPGHWCFVAEVSSL
eukprot:4007-Heterococcus_DN1.PRE.5